MTVYTAPYTYSYIIAGQMLVTCWKPGIQSQVNANGSVECKLYGGVQITSE